MACSTLLRVSCSTRGSPFTPRDTVAMETFGLLETSNKVTDIGLKSWPYMKRNNKGNSNDDGIPDWWYHGHGLDPTNTVSAVALPVFPQNAILYDDLF